MRCLLTSNGTAALGPSVDNQTDVRYILEEKKTKGEGEMASEKIKLTLASVQKIPSKWTVNREHLKI